MALLERTSLEEILTTYRFARVPEDAGVEERFRTLFYLFIRHGRRHGWRWTPTQSDHKRLLNTEARAEGKIGNAKAFCKCLLSLVESLPEEFGALDAPTDPTKTANAILTAEYGDPRGAWVAKPSNSGIDAAYKGNIVTDTGELSGYAILPAHHLLLAFGRIFDPALGWEHPFPGKTAYDWKMEYRAHRQHAAFNAAPVHFAIWEADPVAHWDDSVALMSVEWPPGDEETLVKACTGENGEVAYERVEHEKSSGMLPLVYPFMRFRDTPVLRAARSSTSLWYLWHAVDLDAVIAREAAEEKARIKAAKRQAQLERIHGKKTKKK